MLQTCAPHYKICMFLEHYSWLQCVQISCSSCTELTLFFHSEDSCIGFCNELTWAYRSIFSISKNIDRFSVNFKFDGTSTFKPLSSIIYKRIKMMDCEIIKSECYRSEGKYELTATTLHGTARNVCAINIINLCGGLRLFILSFVFNYSNGPLCLFKLRSKLLQC